MFASIDTSSGAFLIVAVLGTIAFALSGVLAAAEADMDWLGAVVLAVVVAIGGGTIRDFMIGNLPVSWVDEEWPVVVAIGTAIVGVIALRIRPEVDPRRRFWYLASDAIGLGAFVVLGTSIAIERGTSLFIAVLMGVITGVGGGVIRDVFTSRTPMVFVGQVYAVAGLVGAITFVGLNELDANESLSVWAPTAVVVIGRAIAIRYDLHLPRAAHKRGGT
jgi:uncharacterized membrane protein YeiH